MCYNSQIVAEPAIMNRIPQIMITQCWRTLGLVLMGSSFYAVNFNMWHLIFFAQLSIHQCLDSVVSFCNSYLLLSHDYSVSVCIAHQAGRYRTNCRCSNYSTTLNSAVIGTPLI